MDQQWELNEAEWSVFENKRFMPLKERVLHKLEGLLGDLASQLTEETKLPFSFGGAKAMGPKISRGENYQSYAYRVLDYPRLHDGHEFMLFRTMILWGHPIGFHLILSQEAKAAFGGDLGTKLKGLPSDWRLSQQDTPWLWEPNWKQLPELYELSMAEVNDILRVRKFCKISRFLPIELYQELPTVGLESWQSLSSLWD